MNEVRVENNKGSGGFTLIELLVVIGIIAILVLLVIVAISPVQRVRDAKDSVASSNVRSAGSLISTCVTIAAGEIGSCETEGDVITVSKGSWPSSTDFDVDPGVDVCAEQKGSDGVWFQYKYTTGETKEFAADPPC